jgi:hypothetical protein
MRCDEYAIMRSTNNLNEYEYIGSRFKDNVEKILRPSKFNNTHYFFI